MKTLPSKTTAFLVGLLELGLIVFAGWMSGTDAGGSLWALVVASIVCTSGLSVLIWIPVLIGMGMITLDVVSLLPPNVDQPSGSPQTSSGAPDTRITGLKRYIDRLRADGVADEIIHDHLRRAGWSEGETTSAMHRS